MIAPKINTNITVLTYEHVIVQLLGMLLLDFANPKASRIFTFKGGGGGPQGSNQGK